MAMSDGRKAGMEREARRAAGLRPVRIWVPDTRVAGFLAECRRQAMVVAAADAADSELSTFLDVALAEVVGESGA